MTAIRLPLLYAFAGGCLGSVVMFGLWRAAEGTGDSAVKQQHRSDNVVAVTSAPPTVTQASGLVATGAADQRPDDAPKATTPSAASDLEVAGPTLAGSAVSDVLTQLEAAYRQRVAAPAPSPASSPQVRETAAAPADGAVAAAEAAPGTPTQAVAEVVAAVPPAAATEPRAFAPAPAAPAPLAPQVSAVPAVAGPDAPPPSEIHYGDVNQNTYITNVRQGDVYLIQMQQVALLQYMQLLGMSSGVAAPARRVGGAGRQRGALASGITNPDNPWGFHFAPPNLVR